MKPYFSILIPVYNQVGLMDECIKSLKNQTFKDFEVIVVDDGSTDASYEMLTDIAKEDPRFKILKHEGNKSLATARYTAMKEVTGEYILFLDSDDYYFDYTCEKLHDYLGGNPVDVVRFGYLGIRADGTEENPPVKTDDPYISLLKGEISPTVWKNCYSRKVIDTAVERVEPFYCNMGEDVFWGTVLFSIAESFGTINEYLHNYMIGEGMSTNLSKQTLDKLKRNIDSTKECGRNLTKYVEKYDVEHKDMTHNKILSMQKYTLLQSIFGKNNMSEIIKGICLFDSEDTQEVFDYGCSKLVPFVVRMAYGLTDEVMNNIGISVNSNDIFS